MHRANPDGCGFATLDGRVFKSLSYTQFLKEFRANVTKETAALIHFRWATHGSIKPDNCHPFSDGRFVFAHNGVLPIASINDKTDSEILFETLLPNLYDFGANSDIIKNVLDKYATSSRFAIFDTQNKQVRLFGTFYDINGCLYSNVRWLWCA